MDVVASYRVVAHNTATASSNKIHDDDVARRYGFAGGLVPGVDVYAYLTHLPAARWGLDWLASGTMRARFSAPVYEGAEVTVTAIEDGPASLSLELRDPGGVLCATGEATMPGAVSEPGGDGTGALMPDRWPASDPAISPPPASPQSLAAGTPLALPGHVFQADQAGAYLAEVRETLPLYAEDGVAHPGWLLRDANYVLSANAVLGPWIHVESVTRHHGLVRDGDRVEARAVVTREWEHKGHRFVELDVGLLANAARVVAHVTHTAIYQPRASA